MLQIMYVIEINGYIFILPSIRASNQGKCAYKLLKLILDRKSSSWISVPFLEPDEKIAEMIAEVMVFGNPSSILVPGEPTMSLFINLFLEDVVQKLSIILLVNRTLENHMEI